MPRLDQFLTIRNQLQQDYTRMPQYRRFTARERDKVLGVKVFAPQQNHWTIMEYLINESIGDSSPGDDWHLTLLLNCAEHAYTYLEYDGYKTVRPPEPGRLIFFQQGHTEGRGPFHSISLRLDGAFIRHRLSEILGYDAPALSALIGGTFLDDGLLTLLQRLNQQCVTVSSIANEDLIDMICMRLLKISQLKFTELGKRDGLTPAAVQRVIEYLHAHHHREITRDEMAQIAGVTPHYFSRMFRKAVGQTPTQFLTVLRVERAKALLKTSNDNLYTIAKACGFYDGAHFSVAFRKLVGTTPQSFRHFG